MNTTRRSLSLTAVAGLPLLAATLAMLAALAALAAPAFAKDGADVTLVSTGVDANATGRAKMRVKSAADARFELRLGGLDPASTFQVVVSDIVVDQVTTDATGAARTRLRSQPRSSTDVLLGFDPRGSVLIIRDAAGQDVLAGDVPAGGNAADATKIVCCVPDDKGTECEDRTADECTAEGGTASAATTCLPNPCDTTVVPTEDNVVCCLPDDSGPECDDRTVAECSAQGGIVVAADSCLDNPCAAVPPVDSETRCCEADDSGNECETRLPSECLARGGVDIGAGVCSVDACAGIPIPTGSEALKITCEKRSDRSRASVDASGLRDGSYTAHIVSGASDATSAAIAATSGQAEFDFDSDGGDIAGGDTAIAVDFLTGAPPTLTAQILDDGGNVIVEGTATCLVK